MNQPTSSEINLESSLKNDWNYFKQTLQLKPLIILLSVAILLTFQYYFGKLSFAQKLLNGTVSPANLELAGGLVWCGIIFSLYAAIPILLIKLVFKESLVLYGMSLKGLKHHWKPYVILYLLMFIPLYIASLQPAFRQVYPFIKSIGSPGSLFAWEIAYGMQFFAVEFLFRGFILFGLKEKFGWYSLFIMAIPYCMIHFGKPMGESLGAIFAGIFLGYLALKSQSIYGGVMLHWMIALTMDLLVLIP